MLLARIVDTAAGRLILEASASGIAGIEQVGADVSVPDARGSGAAEEHLARLAEQVGAYLDGELRQFDVPLDWAAAGVHDEFSREVYRAIGRIPYGETSTYGQISIEAGRPRNARRVGRLCSLVPVPFVIPVHRVIRADGGLGNCPGYRLRLIDHERRNLTAAEPVGF